MSQPPKKQASDQTKLLKRMWLVLKWYWPLLVLMQFPLLIACVYITKSGGQPDISQIFTKATESQTEQIRNLEAHVKKLGEKVSQLHNQHTEVLSELKATKAAFNSRPTVASGTDNGKRQIYENLDRIGEKIKLNEPFYGLLVSLPKDCINFPGYQTLHKYSRKLPLTFLQLKKMFDDIYKSYIPRKTTNIHPWLAKFASLFRGHVKIERINGSANPLQPALEALDVQDLRSALLLVKDVDFQSLNLWKHLAQERVLLESDYLSFVEKVQMSITQITDSPSSQQPTEETQKESRL